MLGAAQGCDSAPSKFTKVERDAKTGRKSVAIPLIFKKDLQFESYLSTNDYTSTFDLPNRTIRNVRLLSVSCNNI